MMPEADDDELKPVHPSKAPEHLILVNNDETVDHDEDAALLRKQQLEDSSADSFWDDDYVPPPATAAANDPDHSIIDVLTEELLQRPVPEYLEAFEVVIPDSEVVVGSVPLAEVQQREREIEDAKIRRAQLESELYRQREAHLAHQEDQVRRRLLQEAQQQQDTLHQNKLQAMHVLQLRTKRLGFMFQRAENHLRQVVARQEAHVDRVYGHLEPSQIAKSRKRYRVEWQKIPLTIKIRARMLKAVKDKLPVGNYVMVATLYDRLGGHALQWSAWEDAKHRKTHKRGRQTTMPAGGTTSDNLADQLRRRFPNLTKPFHHRGRFYNTELNINQTLYVVCPPETMLRPANVLLFELFYLSPQQYGNVLNQTAKDHVMGWGVLPLSTPDFEVVKGKYKVPLLRGDVDPTMDKFRDIEAMYQDDLSSWLCNFYFQISHLEKECHMKRDFDVELDEQTALLRLERATSFHTMQLRHQNSAMMAKQHVGDDASLLRTRRNTAHKYSDGENGDTTAAVSPTKDGVHDPGGSSSKTLLLDDNGDESKKKAKSKSACILPGLRLPWQTSPRSAKVHSGDPSAMSSSTATAANTDASGHVQAGGKQLPTIDDDLLSASDGDSNDSNDSDHDGRSPRSPRSPRAGVSALDVDNYKFSVNDADSFETAQHRRFHIARKLHFLRHEVFLELGLTKVWTMEFWLMIVLLLFSLWLRLYVHFVLQYVYLKAQRIPVYYFAPQWTTCIVKYTGSTLATSTEVGVILIGAVGPLLLFGSLALAATMSQRHVGELPAFGSKLIVCFGVGAVLDPVLVFLVDLVEHHYNCVQLPECAASLAAATCKCVDGDAFKLYARFLAQEGSGLVGIIATFIIYAAVTCVALVAVYTYLLYVHMNGRMLDVYRRLHAQESDLFLPHDCEISLQELTTLCDHAARWKGPRGTQRKVFVHEYVLTDPLDPSFQDKSTHIALYNMELDGTRQLHRHFLKAGDGSILELFGEIGDGMAGTWRHSASATASLALLYNIIQEHHDPAESPATQLADVFDTI
ncbi:TPA: hypothetical protein N0F65_005053 [Lagenidium giganteum]|uniref:Uncharacterized protein n=1 Tax=Lagenidium giganteum TaxID=4803 RepID=A0AAV2ZCL9_9STRA|nr:TPA: hypothetical protein N0F65_005053 [Lagenidium giganteum]